MKTAHVIKLGIGAAILFTVGPADAQTTNVPAVRTMAYPGVGVVTEEFIGEKGGTQYFVSPNPNHIRSINEPTASANPQAWVHVEEPQDRGSPGHPVRSAIILFEFDCSGKAMRQKLSIVAADNDLKNSYAPLPQPSGAWLPVGTEGIFNAYPKVCGSPAAGK